MSLGLSRKNLTLYGDGVRQEDGAADAVGSRENEDQVALVARLHRRYRFFVELKHRLNLPTDQTDQDSGPTMKQSANAL